MLRKNRGICGVLGTSWVLITMAPRNSSPLSHVRRAHLIILLQVFCWVSGGASGVGCPRTLVYAP